MAAFSTLETKEIISLALNKHIMVKSSYGSKSNPNTNSSSKNKQTNNKFISMLYLYWETN